MSQKPIRVTQHLVVSGKAKDAKELYRKLKLVSEGHHVRTFLVEPQSKDSSLRIEIEIEVEEEGKTLVEMLNFPLPPLRFPPSPHPNPDKLKATFSHRQDLIKTPRTWSVCSGLRRALQNKLSSEDKAAFKRNKGRGNIFRLIKETTDATGVRFGRPRDQKPKRRSASSDWYRDLEQHLDNLNLEEPHETELRKLFNFLVSIRFKLYWELRKNAGVNQRLASLLQQGDNDVGVEEGVWLMEQVIRWIVTQAYMVRNMCNIICDCKPPPTNSQ